LEGHGDQTRAVNLVVWLRSGPVIAVVVVTAMTLAIVGGVIFAATGAGCKVGLKLGRCATNTASVGPVIPSPTYGPKPGQPPFQYKPPAVPPASAPYVPPAFASPAYPPPNVGSSSAPPTRDPSWPPYQYDASSAFPPIYSVSSQPLPSNIALSCRLPVYAGGPGSGGFIEFPARDFVADPRSATSPPSPPAGYTPPPPGPYGQSVNNGISYDRVLCKWLPVPHNLVSPDGTRYAYVFPGDQGVYIIDANSGAQTEIGDGKQWNVLALDATSVYGTVFSQQGPLAGLWQLPYSGTPRQITTAGYWSAVGGGAAYGTSTSAVPQGATNIILRLDLKTGTSQPWFEVDHSQASVGGFDPSGNPLIIDNVQTTNSYGYQTYATQVWDVPGIGTGYVIASNPPFGWPAVADSHGVWFPGGNQPYLFIPGQGVFVVANIGGNPAGECAT